MAAQATDPAAITFDEYDVGTTITDEYAASHGVAFTSDVFTSEDRAQPTTPALSGVPKFHGDIDARFVDPATGEPATVLGFELDVGFIDNRDSVEISYYDAAGNRLGSTRAQSLGINHVEVVARGIASFSVGEISFEAAGFTIDNLLIQRSGVGQPVSRMASLGDSYSSGEGLLPERGLRYDCGTDLHTDRYYENTTFPARRNAVWLGFRFCDLLTGSTRRPADLRQRRRVVYRNLCHRHRRAYHNQIREQLGVAPQDAIFVACSAARTVHIDSDAQYPRSPFTVHGGRAQADTVGDFSAGGMPDLVTVGIGGNDAGFSSIIMRCLVPLRSCADEDFARMTISTVNGSMFRNVRATLANLRARFSPATVIAFGYPSIVDDPSRECVINVGSVEWSWIKHTLLPTVNDAIKDAAADAGVAYADITDATAGHGICADDPWINGIRLGNDQFVVGNESFHPNQRGHDAITRFFIDRYTDGNGNVLLSNPDPAAPLRPSTGTEIRFGEVGAAGAQPCGTDCLQPTACVQACNLHIQGSGFAPEVPLRVTLESEPVDLGQVTTDAEGALYTNVRLPRGISPGTHTLTLEGTAPDGTLQQGIQIVGVYDRLRPRVSRRFRTTRRGTRIRRLTLSRLPRGTKVIVGCARGVSRVTRVLAGARSRRARGCPFTTRSFKLRGRRRSLSLTRRFRRTLPPKTVVRLLITAPAVSGRSLDITIRRNRKPRVKRNCLPPESRVPGRC